MSTYGINFRTSTASDTIIVISDPLNIRHQEPVTLSKQNHNFLLNAAAANIL